MATKPRRAYRTHENPKLYGKDLEPFIDIQLALFDLMDAISDLKGLLREARPHVTDEALLLKIDDVLDALPPLAWSKQWRSTIPVKKPPLK